MIPAAAVEAAAEWLPHSDDCEVRPERDCTCWQPRVNLMRAALEAAAPHMLREAYSLGWHNGAGCPTPVDIETGKILPGGAEPDYHPYRPTP